jgi:hypothetical protein
MVIRSKLSFYAKDLFYEQLSFYAFPHSLCCTSPDQCLLLNFIINVILGCQELVIHILLLLIS